MSPNEGVDLGANPSGAIFLEETRISVFRTGLLIRRALTGTKGATPFSSAI